MTILPWREADWIARTKLLLDAFRDRVGRELLPRLETSEDDARALFDAPFVVVAHGHEADPILNYANAAALRLWETDLPTLLRMPSRLTAEPVHRDERARLLELVARDGFIDDYQGVRISTTGKRFLIRRAVVWNLHDESGDYLGQAATFSEWEFL